MTETKTSQESIHLELPLHIGSQRVWQDDEFFFSGSHEADTVRHATLIEAVAHAMGVLIGALVWKDGEWLQVCLDQTQLRNV